MLYYKMIKNKEKSYDTPKKRIDRDGKRKSGKENGFSVKRRDFKKPNI